MKHTIYGVRLKGDCEVRYVGLTYKCIQTRLKEHVRSLCVPGFSQWLRGNLERVEVFPIALVQDNSEEAKATEKVLISLCSLLGHRLFNRSHVAPHLKWNPAENADEARAA